MVSEGCRPADSVAVEEDVEVVLEAGVGAPDAAGLQAVDHHAVATAGPELGTPSKCQLKLTIQMK